MSFCVCIDETGNRYGRLIVLGRDTEAEDYARKRSRHIKARWICLCDCGQVTSVQGHALRQGYVQSCGCLRSENARRMGKAHIRHENKETVI